MTPEDLRAAVAAGIVTEAQAASLSALANQRAGRRAALPQEDEPFEFFRGFSEIFISIGLVILLTGVTALLAAFGGFALLTLVPLASAGIAWWWAGYFTLKRRMTLPSMVLASAYGAGVAIFAFTVLARGGLDERGVAIAGFAVAAVAMAAWYRRFRLPFAAFLTGGAILGMVYSITASARDLAGIAGGDGFRALFDLGESPAFATATLLFGIGAFLVGMWFDTRDPHRLGRHSATAFWCHLLAAPALVNTVALTLFNGGGVGLLSLALVAITVLALVIDRRSFLTAAIAYIAIVIGWLMGAEGGGTNWIFVLMVLGAFITAIGTWWVQLRAKVMAVLPNFPGKSSLPPYGSTE